MKVITVSDREPSLFNLLHQTTTEGLILQTPDGQKFLLSPLEGWTSFEIEDTEDFAQEVAATAANSEFMAFLEARKQQSATLKMETVMEQLGLSAADLESVQQSDYHAQQQP